MSNMICDECETVAHCLKNGCIPKQPAQQDSDCVLVPRVLIGAACSAIDRKRDAPETLKQLRKYTVGDLSTAQPTQSQEPMALNGQRKLVQILAENWRFWPARKTVEQTSLGDVFCSAKGRDLMFGNHEIASDQDSAVVTKEMWSTMRQALAEQPAQQEPVAWRLSNEAFDYQITSYDEEQANTYLKNGWHLIDVLYTSPPARKPLTLHEIVELARGLNLYSISWVDLVRAIEATHGIKEDA